MRRLIGTIAILVTVLALLWWVVFKNQVGTAEVPAAPIELNSASLPQAQLDTSTANAQETATADILFAHNRATYSAATTTQNAAQTQAAFQATEVLLQQTQAQFNLQLAADLATEHAGATATQQQQDAWAAGTTTAIAAVIAAQTQSVLTTQQAQAALVRREEVRQQEVSAFLWAWGPSFFLLIVVAVGIWAFWYLEMHRHVRQILNREQATPAFADPAPTLPVLSVPQAKVVSDPEPITKPDGQMSGWLEEVKDKLLDSEKEDDGSSTA